ncbi:MAG TPA: hypothetical protein PLF26_09630 [Blastocatellia bacterium]|nr:hypothetical protein [Blastocatellia bacterium]
MRAQDIEDLRVVAAQPSDGLQKRQVGFTRPILFQTLTPSDPNAEVGNDAACERVDKRGLANAGLARDEDDLALSTEHPIEPAVHACERAVAPDHSGREVRRTQWRDRRTFVCVLTDEAIAASMLGLDEPRSLWIVVERFAELANSHLQDGVADKSLGPDRVEKLFFCHELAPALDQMVEQRECLGPERDCMRASPQALARDVKPEGTEN